MNSGVIMGTGIKDELFFTSMKFNTAELLELRSNGEKHWRIFNEFDIVQPF